MRTTCSRDCLRPSRAGVPSLTRFLQGIQQIHGYLLASAQRQHALIHATTDLDAKLISTYMQAACNSYQGTKAYLSSQCNWAEMELFVHSKFRYGNVPVDHAALSVRREGLAQLPPNATQVSLRAEGAACQIELVRLPPHGLAWYLSTALPSTCQARSPAARRSTVIFSISTIQCHF